MTEIEAKKIRLADMLRESRRRQAQIQGLQAELTALQGNATALNDEIDKLEAEQAVSQENANDHEHASTVA